jgi:hypothetical protein
MLRNFISTPKRTSLSYGAHRAALIIITTSPCAQAGREQLKRLWSTCVWHEVASDRIFICKSRDGVERLHRNILVSLFNPDVLSGMQL